MKYEPFDRIEIVHMQGELSARWVFVVSGYHKQISSPQVGNFDRPFYHMFSTASTVTRVPRIGPSELSRSLPDAQASRCTPRLAGWNDMRHQNDSYFIKSTFGHILKDGKTASICCVKALEWAISQSCTLFLAYFCSFTAIWPLINGL